MGVALEELRQAALLMGQEAGGGQLADQIAISAGSAFPRQQVR
jgi:hypothetical protein